MDDTRKPADAVQSEEPSPSRRNFLKAAVAGAGASATVLAGAKAAMAQANDPAITPPKEIADAAKAPVPVKTFPMTGANVFATCCKDEGVAALFCCPGNYNIIHAIAETGIPVYSGRHEGSMASAADGFIRVTGEIAATSGTEGPGFTNMIGAIAAANACRTPLLVLASNRNVRLEDTEYGIQMSYQQPATEGMKKYGKRLVTAARVHEYAAYAFRQLKTGVPRPVHLDFTLEVENARFKSTSELAYYYDKKRYRTESKPHPAPADVRAALDLIAQAQRPMIVSSTGVFYSKAWEPLRRFAEKAQIPVVESGPMRGQFSDSHPLSASTAPDALASADVVMLVGQYCMPTVGEFAFGPDTRYIRIDRCAEDIGRNLPVDVGIIADERAAMEAFADQAPRRSRDAWIAEIAAARKKFEAQNEEYYRTGMSYADAVHPAVIAKVLADFLYGGNIPKEETTVVSGGYGIARYTRRWLRAYRPAQIMNAAYQYGAIGPDVGYTVGAGVAVQRGIGVQAAYKGHPLICITGDAGFAFTGMEMETLAKYRIPAIVIVYNNNSWGTWYPAREDVHRAQLHVFQENLRYDKVAEGLGAHGEYVRRPADLMQALQRSYRIAVSEGRPSVINCQAKKEFWIKDQYPPGFLGKVEPGCMAYYH
ncbi:MAG TPA: thiamine pyrophosphate-binding protein [Burkholderiales bacterium]|nr:thiamine pyrophosphate-binding protein [Burkholderiales bacterium]